MSISTSPSLVADLRQRHQELTKLNLTQALDSAARKSFIEQLVASGSALESERDRAIIKRILYFWTADAISRGELARDKPLPDLPEYKREQSASAPDVKTATTSSPGAIDPETKARASIRIAALARQWIAAGKNPGYLITDAKALDQAKLYIDSHKDPDTDAFIEASTAAQHRRKRSLMWGAIGILLAIIGIGALIIVEMGEKNEELTKQKTKLEVALRDKDKAYTEALAARQELRDEARQALDALTRGGEDPMARLKALLKRIGDAQQDELDRLRYIPPDAQTTSQGDRVIVSDPGSQPTVRPPVTSASTCQGVIWLGSDNTKLISHDGLLSELQGTETVKVNDRSNIRLRRAMPSDDYVMATQVGLVPGGATIILTGKPKPITRPNDVVQFFAPVKVPRQYCTRVFIQYAGDRERAEQMRAPLAQLSMQVPAAQRVDKPPGVAQVRYFLSDDEPMADLVASALAPFNGDKKLRLQPLYDFATKPAPGTLEVWIDLK